MTPDYKAGAETVKDPSDVMIFRDLVASNQAALISAGMVIRQTEGQISDESIDVLLAPAKIIGCVLDSLSGLYFGIKVLSEAVKVEMTIEVGRRNHDRRVAAVLYTMSSLLFLFVNLDPVYNQKGPLKDQLQQLIGQICVTINSLNNFIDTYYNHKASFIKMLFFSTKYREKLASFAEAFTAYKLDLMLLLVSRMLVPKSINIGIDTDIEKVLDLIKARSREEQRADEIIEREGGTEFVLKNPEIITRMADELGGAYYLSIKGMQPTDLEEFCSTPSNERLVAERNKAQTTENVIDESASESSAVIFKNPELDGAMVKIPYLKQIWPEWNSEFSASSLKHLLRTLDLHPSLRITTDSSIPALRALYQVDEEDQVFVKQTLDIIIEEES